MKTLTTSILVCLVAFCASGQTLPVPQPSTSQYAISTLNLYPTYTTRAAYQAAFGVQAPAYNPALPIKEWIDPVAASAAGPLTYSVFSSASPATGYIVPLVVPPAQANVNLPGAYTYAPLVVAPTTATEVSPAGTSQALSPDTICLQSDAQALANLVGSAIYPGQTMTVATLSYGAWAVNWGSETRRNWYINCASCPNPLLPATGGITVGNAQQMIEAMDRAGVGYPGSWQMVKEPLPDNPNFTALNYVLATPVTIAPATATTVPVPIRALLANEQFAQLPAHDPFGQWMVQRTDLAPITAAPSAASAQLTAVSAQVANLQAQLASLVAAIQALQNTNQ